MHPPSERSRRRALLRVLLAAPVALAGCARMPGAPAASAASLVAEGQRLFQAGKYDDALAAFRKAVDIDPSHVPAHVGMARCLMTKRAWPDAIASGRRAYELAPNGQDVVAVLAEALLGAGREALAAGRYQEGIGLLFDYVKLQPTNARAYLDLGKALIADKRFGEALQALLRSLGLGSGAERPEVLRALLDGGTQAFASGRFADAIAFLTESIRLDPARVRPYLDLARSYLATGAFADALSTLARALGQAKGGERDEVLGSLLAAGRQALSSGKAHEAVGFLREYLAQERANLQAWLDLGKAYWQSSERLQALDAFRRALEIDPRNSEALGFILRGGR